MKEKKFVETFCTECGKKIVLEENSLGTVWRWEREVKRNEQKETATS